MILWADVAMCVGRKGEQMKTNEQTAIEVLKRMVDECFGYGDKFTFSEYVLVNKFLTTVEAVCRQVRFEKD